MIKKLSSLLTNHQSLIIVLVLAAALRLWSLGSNPPHLYSDEAALGYNAYSILKTARDEHGELLPVVFKSFGDWKPGLYVYLTVPFVWALGLTEWAVRLPGALAGIMAVWLIYLLTGELFQNLKIENFKLKIMASFWLAISPWHIHFSRGAWEANVALTLLLAGVYFFLRFTSGEKNSLFISSALFASTLWAYQGAKLGTLLVVLILTIIYFKNLLKKRLDVLKASALGVLIVAPILFSFLSGKTGRLNVFSVFSYKRPIEYVEAILSQVEGETKNSKNYYLYHSEPLSLTRGIIGRWTNHFSGRFLFFEGDWTNARHQATNTGMLLLVQAPLLALGFVQLFKTPGKAKWLVLAWLVASPLPAALSRDSVHAIRSYNLVVPATIMTALGIAYLTELLRKNRLRAVWLTAFLIVTLLNYIYYLDQYFVHYPKHDSKAWVYGYKQAAGEVANSQDYENIIFQQSYNQPYIFFLFFQKYDPSLYQKLSKSTYRGNEQGDVGVISELGKVTFRNATETDLHKEKTMIVFDPEMPPFASILSNQADAKAVDIKRPDGTIAFRILKFR